MIGQLKSVTDLPIRLKGNSKRISGNSLSPLGAQNKDLGATSQTLLNGVKLRLLRRLCFGFFEVMSQVTQALW